MILLALMLVAALVGGPRLAEAQQVVRVGGYEFAPFVELDAGMRPSGLTADLLSLFNRAQNDWAFQLVVTSPSRRYQDFAAGRYDLLLFESKAWGWQETGLPVEASKVFLTGGEVYVAAARPGRGEEYFADLTGRRMVGIRGYHYGFAGFNADPAFLERNFGMLLVNSGAASLEMVLRQRGDIAVVTDSYLSRVLVQRPELRDQLLVSRKLDQEYNHTALVRIGSSPSAADIDRLIERLEREGAMQRLWSSYGIAR